MFMRINNMKYTKVL